ncbi:MAG: LLM class flavin-dependent oxidoreductase [Rhodocyclaceae bacterium]|nr:LLM class flavin-dependent oxidoreductase [Rhodocyclaceae bacterium]
MLFGVFDHLDSSGAPLDRFFEDRLRLLERYDAAGFYCYHLAEHHGTPLGMGSSPSVFMAAAAQRTKRLKLGPMVYCLPLYHPLRVFEEICMLDQMSGGRLQLGVGRGISPIELAYYGVAREDSPEIYRETFELLMTALATEVGKDLTFEGNHFSVADFPIVIEAIQKPHPPLWYGIGVPDSAIWAAQNAVNIMCNQSTARARAVTDRYKAEWAAAGKAAEALPKMGLTRHIVVADSEAEAVSAGARAYARWRSSFMYLWDRHGISPINVSYPESFEAMQEAGLAIAGTVGTVRDTVSRQVEEAGINYFLGRFAFGDLSFEESARSVELFAQEVAPVFAAAA